MTNDSLIYLTTYPTRVFVANNCYYIKMSHHQIIGKIINFELVIVILDFQQKAMVVWYCWIWSTGLTLAPCTMGTKLYQWILDTYFAPIHPARKKLINIKTIVPVILPREQCKQCPLIISFFSLFSEGGDFSFGIVKNMKQWKTDNLRSLENSRMINDIRNC